MGVWNTGKGRDYTNQRYLVEYTVVCFPQVCTFNHVSTLVSVMAFHIILEMTLSGFGVTDYHGKNLSQEKNSVEALDVLECT